MRKSIPLALLLLLTACNTMEGFGKDMRSAGDGLADSASTVKQKINEQTQ